MRLVYFWEIDETKHDEWMNKLRPLVSAEKYNRAMRFRFPIDRMLTVCAEALVRALACDRLNIRNRDIEFGQNEFGKPYLMGYPGFHFNVSHTRNALAAAVSDSEIGADIERIRKADFKIAARFFAPPEREFVLSSPDPDRAFCEIWTRKEAYVKFLGKGLSVSLPSFDTLGADIKKLTCVFERDSYLISVCGAGRGQVSISGVDHGFIEGLGAAGSC